MSFSEAAEKGTVLWKCSFDKFCAFPSAAGPEDVSRVVGASFLFALVHDSLVAFVPRIKIFYYYRLMGSNLWFIRGGTFIFWTL